MSAILEQPDDAGAFHPVAFESRKLTHWQPGRLYPPYLLELLDVLHAPGPATRLSPRGDRLCAGDRISGGRAARAGTAQPPRDGHSGSKKTLALSRRLVLCPGLTAVVEEHVRSARLPNVQGRPPATGRSAVPIAGRHLAGCRPAVNPCQSPPAGTRRGGCCISPDCLELPRRHLHGHIYRLSAPDRPRVTGSDLQDRHSGDDGAEVRRVGVP